MHSRIPVKMFKSEESESQKRTDPSSEIIPPVQTLKEASEQVINTWNKVMDLKQLLELTAGAPKEPNLDQAFLIEATEMVIAKAIKSIESIAALESQLIFWKQDGPASLLDQANECKQYFEGKLRIDMVVLGLYIDHLEGKRPLPAMERIKNMNLSDDGAENPIQFPVSVHSLPTLFKFPFLTYEYEEQSSSERTESETSGDSTKSDADTGAEATGESMCGKSLGLYIAGKWTKESQLKPAQGQSSLQKVCGKTTNVRVKSVAQARSLPNLLGC
jgi:hypothetical protein